MNRADHAREVRQSLTSPAGLCEKLGWLEGHKRQSRGVLIRCPSHGEREPSCSVTEAPDGTIRIKCFACDFAGDALTMIAFAHGLRLRDDFAEILAIGAELSGNLGLADEIRGRVPGTECPIARPRLAPAAVSTVPPPEYPSEESLGALWRSCGDTAKDGEVVKMLHGRGIDFCGVSDLRLARVITASSVLPSWARYRGKTWRETGHRLLLPAYDCHGAMRSVRAWRVLDNDTPKRLPPGGCRSAELVQANNEARLMLRRAYSPARLFVVEGEPDFLVCATTFGRGDAVIGIGSGSWSQDFAKRVPLRTRAYVATHADDAGDRYAAHVIETLGERRQVWRVRPAA